MSKLTSIGHEYSYNLGKKTRIELSHEYTVYLNKNNHYSLVAEYGATFIHKIRIREITNLGVQDLKVKGLTLSHPDEPLPLNDFSYDTSDDSFIVNREFGFDPNLLRVDYSVYGFIAGVGHRFWTYTDQIPEIIW